MDKRCIVIALMAACDSGGGSTTVDAAPDVAATPVTELSSCPSTVDATVTDTPTMFVPKMTTIGVGDVVKFEITAEHFVLPNTLTTTDPALKVGRGQTVCFRFDVPGTYGFLCGAHGFTGTVVVD